MKLGNTGVFDDKLSELALFGQNKAVDRVAGAVEFT